MDTTLSCPCRRATTRVRPQTEATSHNPSNESSQMDLCEHCVRRGLQAAHKRRQEAQQRYTMVRKECSQRLQRLEEQSCHQVLTNLPSLQHQCQEWHTRHCQLQQSSTDLALSVARRAVQIQQRQSQLEQRRIILSNQVQQLQHFQNNVLATSLSNSLYEGQAQIQTLRFAWAIQALELHRLDVGEMVDEFKKSSSSSSSSSSAVKSTNEATAHRHLRTTSRRAKGIGKIGGLPLPHAGPELYGVLPARELQSALRLVASVTQLVAQCLAIALPHPILLHYTNPNTFAKDFVGLDNDDQTMDIANKHTLPNAETSSNSRNEPDNQTRDTQSAATNEPSSEKQPSSLASILDDLSHSFLSRATRRVMGGPSATEGTPLSTANTTSLLAAKAQRGVVPPSMDPALVQKRVRHARAAVLAENSRCRSLPSSQYTLSTDREGDADGSSSNGPDEFAIALQLLQNDIVALCIRAGVSVDALWPAEAVLLNLHALYRHLKAQVYEEGKAES